MNKLRTGKQKPNLITGADEDRNGEAERNAQEWITPILRSLDVAAMEDKGRNWENELNAVRT